MMHESTVVDLSGPCHHQPPTLPKSPTHLLCTPASEISLDLSPSNMHPPCQPPIPTIRKNMMHQTLTQSRGRDNGRLAWLAMPCTGTGTQARARARARGARAVEELLVLQPAGA